MISNKSCYSDMQSMWRVAAGAVAEMRTGEGKTLVAVLPAFLNALSGKGVHIVTVNDYLARRDSEWVGQVHKFLGLSVGLIQAVRTPFPLSLLACSIHVTWKIPMNHTLQWQCFVPSMQMGSASHGHSRWCTRTL